jgi:RNA polymerase sigma-70 factor (ECF subfamily)
MRGSAANVRAERLITMVRGPTAPAGEAGPAGERRLVRAAQSGSSEALEALFRAHWPAAYRSAYFIVHDAAAAEDIAQEAFLAAVRALDRFDWRRPFAPWINRIVVNRAIDHTRSRALRREVGAELAEGVPAPRPPAGVSDELIAALALLGTEQRAVVVLRYLLDWTPGEIARALRVPRGTVNSRLRRALDQLAETVEDDR